MTLEECKRQIKADLAKLKRSSSQAVRRTAYRATRVIAARAPKAFGDLSNSVHVEEGPEAISTLVDAPHAMAVELGSRPHLVPLEVLTAWVKLRGAQFFTLTNDTQHVTRMHAENIGAQLEAQSQRGHTPVDAPEKIARAIQAAILEHGTKPTRFVQRSLPMVMDILDEEIKGVFK